jgi:hypothetical protein
MPRIEPGLVAVVTDLERGLRELGIPFGIVGALVPDLLLKADEERVQIFEHFRWYRLGAEL